MRNFIWALMLIMLILPISINAESIIKKTSNKKQKISSMQFSDKLCVTLKDDPEVTICVSGTPAKGEVNERSLVALKAVTKNLILKHQKNSKRSNPKFSCISTSTCTYMDWDPAYCDPGLERSFCEVHPTDIMCGGPTSTSTCSYSDWDPAICDLTGMNKSYCETFPADPMCPATTTCQFIDWIPAICDVTGMDRTFCQVFPTNTMCTP